MPDLLTHTASAWILTRFLNAAEKRALLYVGVILPDIVSRPFYIIWPELYFYTLAVHTPVFMLIFLFFTSEFFEQKSSARLFLGIGVFLHFIFDAMQKHLLDGYYWLFPFSWWSYSGGFFWPNQALNFVPVWMSMIIIGELVTFFLRKRP